MCRAFDANVLIGKWWLEMARQKTAVELWRVESKANPSGGPSRFRLDTMDKLGAQYVHPKLPRYVVDFWAPVNPQWQMSRVAVSEQETVTFCDGLDARTSSLLFERVV